MAVPHDTLALYTSLILGWVNAGYGYPKPGQHVAVSPGPGGSDGAAAAAVGDDDPVIVHLSAGGFAAVYISVSAAVCLMSLARNFAWFHATYIAAKRLHEKMFLSMLRAPVAFFHANPHGRILNRFSRDQSVVDSVRVSEHRRLVPAPTPTQPLLLCSVCPLLQELPDYISDAVATWMSVRRHPDSVVLVDEHEPDSVAAACLGLLAPFRLLVDLLSLLSLPLSSSSSSLVWYGSMAASFPTTAAQHVS